MRKQIALWASAAIFFTLMASMTVAQVTGTTASGKSQAAAGNPPVAPRVCSRCVRAHEEFLASDALQGRGGATHDELVTATYVASQLRQYGVEPAGDQGGYIQRVPTIQRKITSAPELKITPAGGPSAEPVTLEYGKEFLVFVLTRTQFSGPLKKFDADKANGPGSLSVEQGTVALITGSDSSRVRAAAFSVASQGAAAILVLDPKLTDFEEGGTELPTLADRLEQTSAQEMTLNVLNLNRDAFHSLEQIADGAVVQFKAQVSEEKNYTWNATGILRGSDSSLRHATILFSAHLDHLGIGSPVNGDSIYNGADDDASGTTAVLEIARVLGRGLRPRRTVIFALFGAEEMGALGSSYFREHPPLPLKDISANLEFEMIGRPDPAVKDDTLWLTGWERSNLGPELAAHGARLVADPHPSEDFFARSDNFVLAKKGVVAQTISSYGLHSDYHQPSDDLAHLDFKHMDAAIGSLLAPLEWLVNSDFLPKWKAGGKP